MIDPTQFASEPAPGRSCGSCTLCCKVYDVPAVDKPMGKWCRHCSPGRGCGIWQTRPDHCRAFFCFWMTTDFLGPEWKPERCAFVLTLDPATRNLLVQVDPGRPHAWKSEPFQSQIRRWAEAGLAERRHVLVFVNRSATLVLPDRDVAVGVVNPGDELAFSVTSSAKGPVVDVVKKAAGAA